MGALASSCFSDFCFTRKTNPFDVFLASGRTGGGEQMAASVGRSHETSPPLLYTLCTPQQRRKTGLRAGPGRPLVARKSRAGPRRAALYYDYYYLRNAHRPATCLARAISCLSSTRAHALRRFRTREIHPRLPRKSLRILLSTILLLLSRRRRLRRR